MTQSALFEAHIFVVFERVVGVEREKSRREKGLNNGRGGNVRLRNGAVSLSNSYIVVGMGSG